MSNKKKILTGKDIITIAINSAQNKKAENIRFSNIFGFYFLNIIPVD